MSGNKLQIFNKFITNEKTQNYLSEVLAEKKGAFVNNMIALVSSNVALQECEPQSLMFAGIKATALGLPLDQSLGFAYVIPYNNNVDGAWVKQAQFQIGYKGFVQLTQRSGQVRTINVRDVREGEIVDEDFISGELAFKKAENREQLNVIGYIAFFELLNGFRKMLYITKKDAEKHGRTYSKTYENKNSVWKTEFDAMAKKTVLKNLIKTYAPMSVEMIEAVKYDQAVIDENGYTYVDNDNNNNTIIDEEKEAKGIEILDAVFKTNEEEDAITDDIANDINESIKEA